jgi:hypothetical protein
MDEKTPPQFDPDVPAYRGLGHDVIVALAAGAAGGAARPVAEAIVDKVTAPKEEPPKVILPPGVKDEDD